jgi:putative protein-disulfide isomerase
MEKEDDLIDVTIVTDPLCCWSWAFESQLQELKIILNGQATWNYRMGGLLPSWNNFHDQINSVSRPIQWGPIWMHAGEIAHKPICHQIWIKDPPASSYPACVAVKCAQLQSVFAGELMLNLLREACMTNGKNIARQDVLFETASRLSSTNKSFDSDRFKEDFLTNKGLEPFRSDLEFVSYYKISRFPALVVKTPNSKAIVMSGYRRCSEVLKTIESLTILA